jgi:hypothetical protein
VAISRRISMTGKALLIIAPLTMVLIGSVSLPASASTTSASAGPAIVASTACQQAVEEIESALTADGFAPPNTTDWVVLFDYVQEALAGDPGYQQQLENQLLTACGYGGPAARQ